MDEGPHTQKVKDSLAVEPSENQLVTVLPHYTWMDRDESFGRASGDVPMQLYPR